MYQTRDFVKAVRLMRSGKLITAPLETRHFPFEEYRSAYDYADREGERSMKLFIDLDTN
jgi:threonine dehydrogenase-like Zn-dependent dehydrogenase